jgi:hypothetical protein
MTDTGADPVQDLNQMIDRIRSKARSDGYEAGYKAAMTAVSNFAAKGGAAHFMTPGQKATELASMAAESSAASAGRAPRGLAKRLVLEALGNMVVPGTAKNVESYLGSRGHFIAYSSIQNAMMQLVNDGTVVNIGRGVWRLKTNTAPSTEIEEAV